MKGLDVPPGWDNDDIQEGESFNAAHASNARWHFVNLPLGASGYPQAADAGTALSRFASPDDIVHAINRAIAVLESPAPPASFSKAQAVRWIVHLVGGIHQPVPDGSSGGAACGTGGVIVTAGGGEVEVVGGGSSPSA